MLCLTVSFCFFAGSGCGGPKSPDVNVIRDAQKAFNAGLAAFEAGNNAEAIAQFTAALQSETINGDMVGEAYILRAVAHARTGDYASAHADLDRAELGAAEDRVFSARSFVFGKQGKTTESAQAMRSARQRNADVETFKH